MKIKRLTAKDVVAILDAHDKPPTIEEITKEFVLSDDLNSLMIDYWSIVAALNETKKKIRRLAKEEIK